MDETHSLKGTQLSTHLVLGTAFLFNNPFFESRRKIRFLQFYQSLLSSAGPCIRGLL